jgi:hypothetical protein
MPYRLLADGVLVVHAAFVALVVLGGLVAWRRPWFAWVHLPAAAWGALIEFTGGTCPLTPLENRFRGLAGDAGYEGGFIEHYVTSLLYPEGLTRGTQLVLGVGVLVLNAIIYGVILRRRAWRTSMDS